jgi:hypothetical protein
MKQFGDIVLREEYFGGFLYRFDDRKYTVIKPAVWKDLKNANIPDGAKRYKAMCQTKTLYYIDSSKYQGFCC